MSYKYQDPQVTQVLSVAESVAGVAVTTGGAGYTSAPAVSLGAPNLPSGIQATATATILAGAVNAITVTNPGSGYTAAPTVTLTGGGFTTAATAASSIASTSIQSAAFGPVTYAVRVVSTGNCHFHIGDSPVAVASNAFLSANQRGEFISVDPGSKIAVIQDASATGNVYVTELSR